MKNIRAQFLLPIDNNITATDVESKVEEGLYTIESMSGLVSNVSTLFKASVSKGVDKFTLLKNNISNYLDGEPVGLRTKDLITARNNARVIVGEKSFADVDHMVVPTILGLDVRLNEVLKFTANRLPNLEMVVEIALTKISTTVSKIANDSEYRKSFRPATAEYKRLNKLVKDITSELSDIIDAKSSDDRLPLKKLIGNLQVLPGLIEEGIELEKGLPDNERLATLRDKVDMLATKVQYLYDMIKDTHRDEFIISKQALNEITFGLESVANSVSILTAMIVLKGQCNDTLINIVKVLENK